MSSQELGGSASWMSLDPHRFLLCLLWSGDVVDSHCLGGKLVPVKLAFSDGGGGGASKLRHWACSKSVHSYQSVQTNFQAK